MSMMELRAMRELGTARLANFERSFFRLGARAAGAGSFGAL
jgi:hypothetical protein